MGKETMTKAERILTALRYQEKPDRVPIFLDLSYETCARLCGEKPSVIYTGGNPTEYLHKVIERFGDWDGDDGRFNYHGDVPPFFWTPIEWKYPGIDLPEDAMTQCDEKEFMTLEDYDQIIEEGYYGPDKVQGKLWKRMFHEDMPAVPGAEVLLTQEKEFMKQFPFQEVAQLAGEFQSPFFDLSLGRSFIPFTNDLFYRGDLVEKVLAKMMDEIIEKVDDFFKYTDFPVVYFIDERAGAAMFPLRIFERFFLPFFRKLAEAVHDHNGILLTHFDTDWSKNLPLFKDFPDHTLAFELDSLTDIQNAREVLGNKVCLVGDIPGSMMTYGTPEEVKAYIKNNINTVGKDGGYIIKGGCEIPMDAKPENIEAMLEVGRESFY